jgi:hypothetical protein
MCRRRIGHPRTMGNSGKADALRWTGRSYGSPPKRAINPRLHTSELPPFNEVRAGSITTTP